MKVLDPGGESFRIQLVPVGGMGIHLVKNMVDRMSYWHEDGRNRPAARIGRPDYARFSARPRGFAESRASLPGARASSLRQARESDATSTVRGHRCPRSQEDRGPDKPTGPG